MKKIMMGLLGIISVPLALCGTERMPWYGKSVEIEPRITYIYQNYHRFSAGSHSLPYASDDSFIIGSIGSSFDKYAVEYEMVASDTRYLPLGMDCQRLTGRYRVFDDVAGDPVSMTIGVTLTQAAPGAVKDPSSFHHGRVEMEWHAAVGQEWSCDEFWQSRAGAVAGLGLADSGSPWIRADAAWEKNYYDMHAAGIFLNTLWGLGRNNVHSLKRFDGYGPIHHQSIDLGVRYTYSFCGASTLTASYARRLYAKNFPMDVNLCLVSLCVPFGF